MKLLTNITQLITMNSRFGGLLGIVENAAVLIDDGKIAWVGQEKEAPIHQAVEIFDVGRKIVIPGLIDCHTHLIFAGDRSNEFYLRSHGASYGEILKAGGGILRTMKAVREASVDTLVELARPRLARMFSRGVTTIEAKSGYGLTTESELKMLEVLGVLDSEGPISIVATFLGAHAVPPEFSSNRDSYLDLIVEEMLPAVREQGIAAFCDVFIEQGAFSVSEARRILVRAQELKLLPRVHAEQLSHQGGTEFACEVGALSASHLENINDRDICLLAKHGVVAELLPIAQEFLGMQTLAPARKLADAGVCVAIATDFNPGSAMCDDLLLAARLAVTRCKLTCEEALAGITVNAARALGRSDIGVIEVGNRADLGILNCASLWHIFYDWSVNPISGVIKGGKLYYSA